MAESRLSPERPYGLELRVHQVRKIPFYVKSLASLAQKVGQTAHKKRGFAQTHIIDNWPDIMGPELAKISIPERYRRGRGNGPSTLQIRVKSGRALEIQHASKQIIERINSYYGFPAVERLQLIQGPLPRPASRKSQGNKPLPPSAEKWVETLATEAEDPRLRSALTELGRHVKSRSISTR